MIFYIELYTYFLFYFSHKRISNTFAKYIRLDKVYFSEVHHKKSNSSNDDAHNIQHNDQMSRIHI